MKVLPGSKLVRLLPLAFLGLFALTLLVATQAAPPAFAHSVLEQDRDFKWVRSWQNEGMYSVTIHHSAGAAEYMSGNIMVINSHTNGAYVPNGKCKVQYKFCFTLFSHPKVGYSNGDGSTTHTNFSNDDCVIQEEAHGNCFESSTALGFTQKPVYASAERKLGLTEPSKWVWVSLNCGTPSVCTLKTDTFSVY